MSFGGTLETGTLAAVVVLLFFPKRRVSGQMFSGDGILYIRSNRPWGEAREDLPVCWKLISSGKSESTGGGEQKCAYFLTEPHRPN